MVQKRIISETEHIIAIEQDVGGDFLVVTFNSMGHLRNDLQFQGDSYFLKQGISAVGIVALRPNWYPPRAMEEILVVVRDSIKGRKTVTYGHGQGGYGALKYAARLKASATLSFSPQWSINPADVRSFDTRFTSYFDGALGNGLRIVQEDLCNCSFVFFDRRVGSDAKNATKLAALSGVEAIPTPFSMDETIRIITQGRGAARLIGLCTSTTPLLATEFRQAIRAARRRSSSYLDSILHKLILRTGKSRSHPSDFVLKLLGRNEDDKPFYSALIAHATGDASLAQSEMARVDAEDFDKVDLPSWWQLAHKLRFMGAELAVAAQILERVPSNTGACLQAIHTLIATQDLERAQRELVRVAKHGDAINRIARFIELSSKLRKPEVLEGLLSCALPHSAKVLTLFSLVDLYQQLDDRRNAFQRLMDLATMSVNSPADLRKVADYAVKLNEVAFALDIRERLLRDAPRDYLLALDVVQVRIPSNRVRALAELREIMSAPDLPSVAWEHASHLYGWLGKPDEELHAITKAIALPDSRPDARRRFAALLQKKGHNRRARNELAALLADGRADANQLRAAADLATILRDRHLAQRFAEAQFQRAPTDSACVLYLARHSRVVGDLGRAERLLSALLHAELSSPSMSNKHWLSLAQELYEVGNIALSKEAVAEAVAREPKNEAARKLAAKIALRQKFGMA